MKQYNRRIGKLMALGCLAIGLLWSKMITVSATTIVDENQITIVEDDSLVEDDALVKVPLQGRVKVAAPELTDRHRATLSWEAMKGADYYRVYRSLTKTGGYTRIRTTRKLSFCDTIEAGVEYFYKIIPYQYDINGAKIKGKASIPVSIIEELSVLKVSGIDNTKTNGLAVSWTEADDADGYRIYRSLYKTKDYAVVAETDAQTFTWTDETLLAGTKYYYKVCAVVQTETGIEETCMSDPVPKYTASEAPSDLMLIQNEKSQVILKWSGTKGTTSYRIYRATSEDGIYERIANKVTANSYTDSNVTAGQTYYYRLAAVHGTLLSKKSMPVNIRVGNIWFSSKTLFVGIGNEGAVQLTATSDLEGDIVFTSADPQIATVSPDGFVCGVSYGKTQIIAEVDGCRAAVDVTVTTAMINGIDVSKWQADIDWTKVRASNVRFAMLRALYATSTDTKFEEYYQGASDQGIDVGVYCYSTAKTVREAKTEAKTVVKLLNGRPLQYPIALDLEDNNQINYMTKEQRMEAILAYKAIVEKAGYQFILYVNLNWLNHYIDQSVLGKEDIDIWIARYRDQNLGHCYTGKGNVCIWQYSDKGIVDGIKDAKGNYIEVDLDVCYGNLGE